MRNLIFVALTALLAFLGFRYLDAASGGSGAMSIIVLTPFIAHFGARWIAGTLGFTRRVPARSVQGAWQGRYYAYTGHRDASREMVGFKTWLETEALPNVRRLD